MRKYVSAGLSVLLVLLLVSFTYSVAATSGVYVPIKDRTANLNFASFFIHLLLSLMFKLQIFNLLKIYL